LSNEFHSQGGPMTVEDPPTVNPLTKAFVRAGGQMGYPTDIDYNGAHQRGFVVGQRNTRCGARCSTAKSFLIPAIRRSNLHILTRATVKKIIFEQGKAVGVLYDRYGGDKDLKAYT